MSIKPLLKLYHAQRNTKTEVETKLSSVHRLQISFIRMNIKHSLRFHSKQV